MADIEGGQTIEIHTLNGQITCCSRNLACGLLKAERTRTAQLRTVIEETIKFCESGYGDLDHEDVQHLVNDMLGPALHGPKPKGG